MASLGVQARGARRSGMTAFPSPPVSGAQRLRPVFHILLTLLAMVAIAVRPAMAQSILRDAETEALFQDMMDPLTVAAGLQPGQVRVPLLGDRSINAFVAGSQAINAFSGLLQAAASAAGVRGEPAPEKTERG